MMKKPYDCQTATYKVNKTNEFVAYCAPPPWKKVFNIPEVKKDLNELTPFLLEKANSKRHSGIEPPMPLMLEALNRVAPKDVKVVVLGQDPTPQAGKATGLAFSVPDARSVGTVLNVLLEVALEGYSVDITNGDLSWWAKQGVLLLNTDLTVERGRAGSHILAELLGYIITFVDKVHKCKCSTFCMDTLGITCPASLKAYFPKEPLRHNREASFIKGWHRD